MYQNARKGGCARKGLKDINLNIFDQFLLHLSEERGIDIGDLPTNGYGSRVISRISEENESNISLEEDTAGSQLVNAFETRNGIFYEL